MAATTRCTSFHFLDFVPGLTFTDPTTADGKLWRSALKYVTQRQGWWEIVWGARGDMKGVDLFLYWDAEYDLTEFLNHDYGVFLLMLQAWLEPIQPRGPFCCKRVPVTLNMSAEGVSTVYLLHFDDELHEGVCSSLGMRVGESNSAFHYMEDGCKEQSLLHDGHRFLGLNGAWIVQCRPPIDLSEVKNAIADSTSSSREPKTLFVVETWTDRETAQLVYDFYRNDVGREGFEPCYVTDECAPGQTGFEKHQTSFEVINRNAGETVDNLDTEERLGDMWARLQALENASVAKFREKYNPETVLGPYNAMSGNRR